MSSDLTFDMGNYPALLPGQLRYCKNHMWAALRDGGVVRFGFSSYAIRLMQDVYFLEWCVNEGDQLSLKQQIGNIETSKATSDLFAPIAGALTAINQEVLKDPSLINSSPHDLGWLFEITGDPGPTISVQEYYEFLEANWAHTQRIIKGQMGDD